MNMKMPGFTAESALYKSRAVYAPGAWWMAQGDTAVVRPAVLLSPPPGGLLSLGPPEPLKCGGKVCPPCAGHYSYCSGDQCICMWE